MATTKNTADLLAQAGSTLPDNTTQQISPQDVREMAENNAQSSYNKITDSALVGLKEHSTIPTYESGQGAVSVGKIYISNKVTGPGAFVGADWDLYSDLSTADKAKLDFITVTSGADLDQMQTDIAALEGARINKGTFQPSLGSFPGGGTAQDGWTWIATDAGVIDGMDINADDAVVAVTDNASTSTAADWHLQDNTDRVLSVNSQSGNVVLDKTDIGLSNVPNVDATLRANHTGTQTASTISDFDTEVANNTAVAANTTKVTNQSHSGDMAGATTLTAQKPLITGKALVTADGADHVLISDASDSDELKKVLVSDFGGSTNLGIANVTATNLDVTSDTGTDATLPAATASDAGLMTGVDKTKLGHISVTQAVDLDTIESDTATNNAKVTNSTHSGDMAGATTLTAQKPLITGKALVTADGLDHVLISDASDSDNLKKVLVSDFLGGGGGGATEVGIGTDSLQQVGVSANASGLNAIALGVNAVSSQTGAVSFGFNTDSTGIGAVAIGNGSQSIANQAIAIGGLGAIASQIQAIAIGHSAVSSAVNSVAIGYNTDATTNGSVAIGSGAQAIGTGSFSLGNGCLANGSQSIAIGGQGATASQLYAVAIGFTAVSTGQISMAIGTNNTASATRAVSVGGQTNLADGSRSAIFGGQGNDANALADVHIFGNAITATDAAHTHVNNLKIMSGGFKIAGTTLAATKTISTDFLEVEINGVTRYLPLYD